MVRLQCRRLLLAAVHGVQRLCQRRHKDTDTDGPADLVTAQDAADKSGQDEPMDLSGLVGPNDGEVAPYMPLQEKMPQGERDSDAG